MRVPLQPFDCIKKKQRDIQLPFKTSSRCCGVLQ